MVSHGDIALAAFIAENVNYQSEICPFVASLSLCLSVCLSVCFTAAATTQHQRRASRNQWLLRRRGQRTFRHFCPMVGTIV